MAEGEERLKRLGRYEIVAELASGGMAEVLLGRLVGPSGFEGVVAIKRILPRHLSEPSFVDMFLDEARIAARIRHPNVVEYLELVEQKDELFIVMEYLEGESIASIQRRARSRRAPFPIVDAVYLIAQAAAGLHAAHELRDTSGALSGLVHRDVSPQNVFVTYDGNVKVMDFGIAKAAGRISQTAAGALKGKAAYMSPEQATGEPLERSSDVFSLGTVLYELSTGRRLFRGASATATLRAVRECRVTPPTEFLPDYPASLQTVCLRALAREPGDRYESAEALRTDLTRVSRELSAGDAPEAGTKRYLRDVFADRIKEKRELRRRFEGSAGQGRGPRDLLLRLRRLLSR